MACTLSLGRLEPCKDVVGGIRAVYFSDFGGLGTITKSASSDEIATFGGNPSFYEYEVKGNSTFTQNIQANRENGTTAFEQVLELTLHKLTKEDHDEWERIYHKRKWNASYPFSVENVKEFAEFCRFSGGFKIC